MLFVKNDLQYVCCANNIYKKTYPCKVSCIFLREIFLLLYYRLYDFSFTISRCYEDVYINKFFPSIARLWNSLPVECFPLTYDPNGFKSRINRRLSTVGSFQIHFLYASIFCVLNHAIYSITCRYLLVELFLPIL